MFGFKKKIIIQKHRYASFVKEKLNLSCQKYLKAHLHDGINKMPPVNTLGDMACTRNVWDCPKTQKSPKQKFPTTTTTTHGPPSARNKLNWLCLDSGAFNMVYFHFSLAPLPSPPLPSPHHTPHTTHYTL